MAGTLNAGSIIYEVDMDTARLLAARREVDAALSGMNGTVGRLDATVTRAERSVASMQRTMSSLSAVARGVIAAISVQQVAAYGNEWVTVNNKLANSVRANESLADVTQRVFDISQNTMSSLAATATLYGRLERATRSAGTSTKDLITLTSTINKGLAVSGATTEEASSTMTQLSQALASGVLRGEEFNSISENGSRLAVALADSLGVTIGQLRAMAAQGKLTTEVVVNGLLKQSSTIAKEFANTTTTMGQAFTIATNNITKFVGESSSVSTSIRVFNEGVISLSQNLDVVANVIGAAAVIFGSRFAGALALATKSRIADAMAARAQAIATSETAAAAANAARVTTIKAGLDKEMALSNLALAQTEYNVARGTAAEAFALDNLIAKKSIAIQMSATHADAQLTEAAATRTATAAATAATTSIGGLARNALGLIGGPAGVAVIAAAGLFYFYQKAQQAKQESIDFANTLDTVISKMKEMGQVQLKGELAKTADAVDALKEKLAEHRSEQDKARESVAEFQRQLDGLKQSGAPIDVVNDAQKRLTDSMRSFDKASSDAESTSRLLGTTLDKQSKIQGELNEKARESDAAFNVLASNLKEKIPNASSAAISAMVATIQVLDKLKAKSGDISQPEEPEISSKAKDLIQNAERRLALSKLEGEARARLQAQYDAEDAGIEKGSQLVGVLQEQYAETERNSAAKKANTKESNSNASAQEAITQKLSRLKEQSELVAGSTSEMSRERAILTAQQSLGKSATQEQIALAGQYAARTFDTAAAIKKQADAERERQQVNSNFTGLQNSASPTAQADNTFEKQMADLNAYAAMYPQKVEQVEAVRAAIEAKYREQRKAAQWEEWSQQNIATQLFADALQTSMNTVSSSITGVINGTQDMNEALGNIANTVLSSVVQSFVEMGVEWVKSAVMGGTKQIAMQSAVTASSVAGTATTASASATAAGTTLAAWTPAALVASIGSFGGAAVVGLAALLGVMAMSGSIAGKRKNGGPVSAGSMYQVGEGGMPEIYRASNGSQYMIPGDNGSVISNKDLSAGGSGQVQVSIQFIDQTTGSHMYDAQATQSGNAVTVQAFIMDMNQGGPMSQAVTSNLQTTRRARE